MVIIEVCRSTLPAYRHIFSEDKYWTTSGVPLFYLDLAVPNSILFKKHLGRFLPKSKDFLLEIKKGGFHPDDCISFGCGRNSIFYYSTKVLKRKNRIIPVLFDLFIKKKVVNLIDLFNIRMSTNACTWSFHGMYPSVLKGLYSKRSEQTLREEGLWDYFSVAEEARLSLFRWVMPDLEHLEFLLEVANRTKFDFWGMRQGRFEERVVNLYIMHGKCRWIEMLLDYGFVFTLENGVPAETGLVSIDVDRMRETHFEMNWNGVISHKFLVWFFAIAYMTNSLTGFIPLYRKLYLSLPLPYMSPSLFRKNIQQVITHHGESLAPGGEDTPFRQAYIESMVEEFEQWGFYPSVSDVPAPIELSHQCRRFIRERLRRNFLLPTAIDDFDVPTQVKSFLKLER